MQQFRPVAQVDIEWGRYKNLNIVPEDAAEIDALDSGYKGNVDFLYSLSVSVFPPFDFEERRLDHILAFLDPVLNGLCEGWEVSRDSIVHMTVEWGDVDNSGHPLTIKGGLITINLSEVNNEHIESSEVISGAAYQPFDPDWRY